MDIRGDDFVSGFVGESCLGRCERRNCDQERDDGAEGAMCWLRVKQVLIACCTQNDHLAELRLRTCQATAEAIPFDATLSMKS